MTEERIQKLEGLGFVWALKAQRGPNAKWDDRLQEVGKYNIIGESYVSPHQFTIFCIPLLINIILSPILPLR